MHRPPTDCSEQQSEHVSYMQRWPFLVTSMVPFTVGADDKVTDLFSLFDVTVQRLLEANK